MYIYVYIYIYICTYIYTYIYICIYRLWESSFGQKSLDCNLRYVSKQIFGSADPVRLYASIKLMSTFGSVFFEQAIPGDKKDGYMYVYIYMYICK
jgi:hypothetical protein